MKKNILKPVLLIGLILVVIFSCKKDNSKDSPIGIAKLTTTEVSAIEQTSALSGGKITFDGGSKIDICGVCWSTSKSPTTQDNKTIDELNDNSFTSKIKDLKPSTTYYVRAYATNSEGIAYGEEISFTTLEGGGLPELTTSEVSEITSTTAKSGGKITDDKDVEITEKGVCWSVDPSPTINNDKSEYSGDEDEFEVEMTDLLSSTTYYVRAYAKTSRGVAYGKQVSFTTEKGKTLPLVVTSVISEITQNSAISGGEITDDGGSGITLRGVCWSTSHSPTIKDNKTENGEGTGKFNSQISGLTANTTYYVRAYAENSKGIGYGEEIEFKTLDGFTLATVTTDEVSNIDYYSATITGEVVNDGGLEVTERGVCWNKTGLPTISNSKMVSDSGEGSFVCNVENLESGTTYFVRAYATNGAGTSYGEEIEFSSKEPSVPTVKTGNSNFVTPISAMGYGEIIDNNGSKITEYGILWSGDESNFEPDYDLNTGKSGFTGNKIGAFEQKMDFKDSRNYTYDNEAYFRAYAVNDKGIGYGEVVKIQLGELPWKKFGVWTGDAYEIVEIGGQVWMAENLKDTHFRDETPIANVLHANWSSNTNSTPAYCWFNDYTNSYGALYNWYAVTSTKSLCPNGWRVPTLSDWNILISYHGGVSLANIPLREEGFTHWDFYQAPYEGTNLHGFKARGGANTSYTTELKKSAYFWTATSTDSNRAKMIHLYYNQYKLEIIDNMSKEVGASVRCIYGGE